MRALFYTETGRVDIQELLDDAPASGEVSVDVKLIGICGSDILGYMGKSRGRVPPLVLGHEFTGRLDGQRVVVNPIVSCGQCVACRAGHDNICSDMKLLGLHRHGAMRERINVPKTNIIVYGDGVADEVMTLTEPFACAIHSVAMVPLRTDDRSLIIGFGCLGSMIGGVLKYKNMRQVDVVDLASARAALGERFGARAITAEAIEPMSYDYVFDCVGSVETHASSGRAVKSGGHIVLVGYKEAAGGIDFVDIVRREYHLHGVMAYRANAFREAARLLENGALDTEGLVKFYDLADGQRAFDDARDDKTMVIKNMLTVSNFRTV